MKSPKAKFVIVSAIGLASIAGIFVFAQSPAPSASDKEVPVHLVLNCVSVDKIKLMAALNPRPSDTYRFEIGREVVGTLPPDSAVAPCPERFHGSATQKAKFANTKELHAFLSAAGL